MYPDLAIPLDEDLFAYEDGRPIPGQYVGAAPSRLVMVSRQKRTITLFCGVVGGILACCCSALGFSGASGGI
jgi:hypothetical protein